MGFDALPAGLAPGSLLWGATVRATSGTLRFAAVETTEPLAFVTQALFAPGVRYVQEDLPVEAADYTPNDPRYPAQYAPQQVRAPAAWDHGLGAGGKSVCVGDTGWRPTHEDLGADRLVAQRDFINNDNDATDDHGHGTHVSGIAVGTIGNGVGIAGIANAPHYVAKVLGASGSSTGSSVALGIEWCADEGADVISLSLGRSTPDVVQLEAVNHAWNAGALVVAAAGNEGPCGGCLHYPGAFPNAIAVACTDAAQARCSFSSQGDEVEIAAPGYQVISAGRLADDAYVSMSGTSMSTPAVSGVAVLVWNAAPDATNCAVRRILRDTVTDLGSPGWDESFGYGLVDAAAAVARAQSGARPTQCQHLPPGILGVNGGAAMGGIGFLLDVQGNDRYDADALKGANGGGYAGGAGLLVDGSGTDQYLAQRDAVNGGAAPGCNPFRSPNCTVLATTGLGLLADGAGADTARENGSTVADRTVYPKGDYGAQLDAIG